MSQQSLARLGGQKPVAVEIDRFDFDAKRIARCCLANSNRTCNWIGTQRVRRIEEILILLDATAAGIERLENDPIPGVYVGSRSNFLIQAIG